METVPVRELRNRGGEALERGETLLVTKTGRPEAELRANQAPRTRDPEDFAGISGVELVAVPRPEAR